MPDDFVIDPPLPGLDPRPGDRAVSALEDAVRRTVLALDELDLLTEADALTLQMMVELAQIITMKKATKRASTISNDLRLLWEIKDSFTVKDEEANERLKSAMDEWAKETGVTIPSEPPP